MIQRYGRAALVAAVLTLAMAASAAADIKDYEFQLVTQEASKGDAVIAVKLVHKPSGRAIPDAVIFAKRIDMAPDNMAAMTAPLELMPTDVSGSYRFKSHLTMAGQWALSLAAKVQGEEGTVQGRLILRAAP